MLVFLGGVIVLIIYMSTLCTNEKFTIFTGQNLKFLVPVPIIMAITPTSLAGSNSLSLIRASLIFERNQFSAIVFLMSYLLIALICVVKLVKFEAGPLTKRL